MISDYNNPYFYQTPPKANNPFLGYQYPAEDHEMKYGIGAYPEQVCDYPPAACFPYPPAYVPVPSPNFPPEQCKVDYVDPPIVKYEYQEPEENFISIDELQYNPTLLKMILPEKIEPEKIKQQIKAEKSRRQGLAQKQATPVKIKAEPPDDWPPISENTVNERIQPETAASESPEIPVLSAVKLERDGSPSNTFPEEFPGQVQIKTEPQYKFSILDESDEEIDENEQGVEFNWMDLEEQEKQEFECCYCAKKVSSSYNLRRHMMIHTGDRPFGCDICLKRFREFSDLKKHRRSHRNHPDYKCLICRKNISNDKDGVKCISCSKKKVSPYGNDYLEELPIIEGFGDKKSFVCPDCGRIFGSRHNLRRHYMIHTGAKPYPCDVCEKCFREVSTLKKHMLTHSRMKLFKCLVCDREYNDYQAFVRHKNSHGDDWRESEKKLAGNEDGDDEKDGEDFLFECNDCHKRFSDVSVYKRHLRIHSHYFTFQCYICKMTFKKCEKLNSHMVTHGFDAGDAE